LPDEIGGIAWYGVDDTYTSCYFPIYCQANIIPEPFATGDINSYSRGSAWWVFNFAANFANVRYRDMVADIRRVQSELEQLFFQQQQTVEQKALTLNDGERLKFLTEYTNEMGKLVHERWLQLGDYLVMKYNDGYVKDSSLKIQTVGYPDEWLKIITETEKYKVSSKK
jgi:dipeptidase